MTHLYNTKHPLNLNGVIGVPAACKMLLKNYKIVAEGEEALKACNCPACHALLLKKPYLYAIEGEPYFDSN